MYVCVCTVGLSSVNAIIQGKREAYGRWAKRGVSGWAGGGGAISSSTGLTSGSGPMFPDQDTAELNPTSQPDLNFVGKVFIWVFFFFFFFFFC